MLFKCKKNTKNAVYRSMDLLEMIKDKVEPDFIGGAVDKSETRVQKRIKVFSEQVRKGVTDMQVIYR